MATLRPIISPADIGGVLLQPNETEVTFGSPSGTLVVILNQQYSLLAIGSIA
jgi:hypothetical protein